MTSSTLHRGHRRTISWAMSGVLVLVLLLPASANGATVGRVGGSFLYGANMPWLHWFYDFGGGSPTTVCNYPPETTLSRCSGVTGNRTEVEDSLKAAHDAGMRLVRWWVFEGGSPQIQRDSTGTPTGLDGRFYADMDLALSLAAEYDLTYDLVLFGGTNDDSQTHQWWEDSAKRQALVNKVLVPLFQKYDSRTNPLGKGIHTWEIVNEPEWQTRNGQTTVAGMLDTARAITDAIHQYSPTTLVTVGNAQLQDMATWANAANPVNLDYYSPHYYDNFGTGSNDPFVTPASNPGGKPVVIGEWQGSGSTSGSRPLRPDAKTRWQDLYAEGYAGGWPWSLSPQETGDQIPIDLNAAMSFAYDKTDIGPQVPGTTAPFVMLSNTSLTFNRQRAGASSVQTVHMKNSGNAPLQTTKVAVVEPSNGFASTSDCTSSSLAPGATCSINVTFAPTTAGTQTGQLTIETNATGGPNWVTLSGSTLGRY